MSSSESSSSAPSPSPPASPEASFHGPPDLEGLISHYVAAKKSLVSTQHVFRANELVTSSRALIEEIAVLNAKNTHARRGVDEQLDTLRAIRDGVADVGETAGAEFKQTIGRLDVANDRLQRTLGSLRKVMIDRSLQKRAGDVSETQAESPDSAESGEGYAGTKRTLYDFVDEANHEELLASLRGLIDSFNDARGDLDDNIARLDDSISGTHAACQGEITGSELPSKPTPYDEPPLPIPALFHDMEAHASEMATLLQSLISHYDLCVSALKHTEGGGEAAKAAIQAEELAKNTPGLEESLYRTTIPEPMDEAERTEMLKVLATDAAEVEDVTAEIRDRSSELEGLYTQLSTRATSARKTTSRLRHAVSILHTIHSTHLPLYLDAVAAFRERSTNVQAGIAAKTQELVGLCGFYEQFLAGYKKLLREVDRRKAAEAQMRKVAEKARKELERLWEADREAREEFVEGVGGFLPGDIWEGLAERGRRWEVREVGGEEDEGGDG